MKKSKRVKLVDETFAELRRCEKLRIQRLRRILMKWFDESHFDFYGDGTEKAIRKIERLYGGKK